MSEVKWIKITTGMFDDEKIKLIRKMPEADSILLTWVQLLVQAGKANASGNIILNETIPYTDEMLAAIFDRPLNVIRLALSTFEQFGMITIEDGIISISNWEKHQNVDGLEKIREQTRRRVAKAREKQKILSCNDTSNVTVTESNAIDKELDIEKEINISIPYQEIVEYLNQKSGSSFRHTSKKTKDLIQARWNDGFRLDEFKKVIDIKTEEWVRDPRMSQYLRPETLFSNKFEGYLNQKRKIVLPKQADEDDFLSKLNQMEKEAKERGRYK